MSEAAAADLATPEAAPAVEGAAVVVAPVAAPAAEAAADATLETPEAVQGEEAAASGQGDGEGEAAPKGGKSEGEAAEGEKPEGDKPAAEGAPEAYADFELPEGFTLPAEFGAELTGLAKELNLPQAKAQELVNMGVKHAQAVQRQVAESVNTAKAVWADEVRNDAEIGGAKLAENMVVAKKAMVAFGSPKLTGLLNQTGLSTHPELLRLLVRVGEAISEDTLVDGGSSEGGKPAVRDHAKRLYPNQK